MNKKIIIGLVVGLGILLVIIITNLNSTKTEEVSDNQPQFQAQKQSIDKVEVFVFHATRRCISCVTIGKYTGETVSEYFQSELKEGKIEFREINIDLLKNKELARKFQASGSSLFINAIHDGQDNINEDVQVWRLIQNETQFKSYLKNKLDDLLVK